MDIETLAKNMGLKPHPEKGLFLEQHYVNDSKDRAKSGCIYYYVGSDEKTKFHKIDCDEYWIYNGGSAIEVWIITDRGKINVELLGTDTGCKPAVYIKKGWIFASKHSKGCSYGTFITCITVPRFDKDGFEMYEDKHILSKYPKIKEFYD